MVLFNKEYTFLVNIIVLLLFLSLKTFTFTEFKQFKHTSYNKSKPNYFCSKEQKTINTL